MVDFEVLLPASQLGLKVNYKRLYSIYKPAGLPLRRKQDNRSKRTDDDRRKLYSELRYGFDYLNHFARFINGALKSGIKIEIFHIVVNYNWEVLYINNPSITLKAAVYLASETFSKPYGKSDSIRMDNGSEFISHLIHSWELGK